MAEMAETNFDELKQCSKEKIADSWQIGWKPKAYMYTSFVLYLKVFKSDLYLFLNIQLQKHNRS